MDWNWILMGISQVFSGFGNGGKRWWGEEISDVNFFTLWLIIFFNKFSLFGYLKTNFKNQLIWSRNLCYASHMWCLTLKPWRLFPFLLVFKNLSSFNFITTIFLGSHILITQFHSYFIIKLMHKNGIYMPLTFLTHIL